MRRIAWPLLLALMLLAAVPPPATGGVEDWVTPGMILDVAPHLWYRMAQVLVDRLYDPTLKLFRETWGTQEGMCWYWNTEQGEASQIVVYLNNASLLADMLSSYKQYLAYDNGEQVYLFSRYTPCSMIRVLSTDPTNFSLGNLIVNIGGDLAGNRTDNGNYTRVIAVSLDIYKDYSNIYELDKAWPNLWYTFNFKGHEVWYLAPGDTGDYKGIWDTSDGSLGTGRIVDYYITYNSTHAEAVRVMSDGKLIYEQHFILEARKPYVKVLLVVRNNSTDNLTNVRASLALDNMDWWLFKYSYLPGIGYFDAAVNGTQVSPDEMEYHLAYSWEGLWESRNGWRLALFYANRPLGMNRGLAVLVPDGFGVHVWGYGNLQSPQKDLYGVPAFTDWYYRWIKFEIQMGDLAPNETRSVELRFVPMASYAPGLEKLYEEMLYNIDSFDGRDFSYAINTGTGAFKGLALAKILLSFLREGDYGFAERVIDSVGTVMERWSWVAATRSLSNYIQALVYFYDYTRDTTYLDKALEAADVLLGVQVKDPSDVRNGGFLDIVYPFGVATYLDVNAEAAHALIELYRRTGNQTYRDAVDYMLSSWFHYDSTTGRWYYYRYRSLQDSPGEYWYKGYLDEKQPYAQGYFLQALAVDYWSDSRPLASANKIWQLLSDELWVLTWEGANETNVETQSSTAAGLMYLLHAYVSNMGAGVEYVRNAWLSQLVYEEISRWASNESLVIHAKLTAKLSTAPYSLATIAFYVPFGLRGVWVDGVKLTPVGSLSELLLSTFSAYYYDTANKLVYVRVRPEASEADVVISYVWEKPPVKPIEEVEWLYPELGTVQGPEVDVPQEWTWKPGYTPRFSAPTWLQGKEHWIAVAIVLGLLFLANEALAPLFAVAGAGLLTVFAYWGWVSVPQMALGLVLVGAGLGFVLSRSRG